MKRSSIAVAGAAIAGLVLLVVVGGLIFIFTGMYNVAATVPHTPLTNWVLSTAMKRSVAVRADEIPPPPPVDSAMVLHGFEHYDEMCVVCHGAPGVERGEPGKGITPEPPNLAEEAAEWSDRELFWITKHGIKMAGMPAFGVTHSDEELWGIVAFLRRLQDMSPAEYRRLVAETQAHADGHGREARGHGGMRGTEAQAHAGMHAETPAAGGTRATEEPAHVGAHDAEPARAAMPGTGGQAHAGRHEAEPQAHAGTRGMDHSRRAGVSRRAAARAPSHPAHQEMDHAATPGRAGAAERPPPEQAPVDVEATEKLKTLAAELVRDPAVLERIQADPALRRRWENEGVRRQITTPPR